MKKQEFEDGDSVKLKGHTDWKYNNKRAGSVGVVFDIFYSEKSGDIVYEIDFAESGMDLVHHSDVEAYE